jgi:hypothetical protein
MNPDGSGQVIEEGEYFYFLTGLAGFIIIRRWVFDGMDFEAGLTGYRNGTCI